MSHYFDDRLIRYSAPLICGLLALLLWQAPVLAEENQQDTQPLLELETANGETVVWLYHPETDQWLPLTLPATLEAAQLEGVSVVTDPVWITLVNAAGDAVAIYQPGTDGSAEALAAVPEGYARSQDGQWFHWSGESWQSSGPPAGDEHPLSWAIQEYVNQNLPQLRLQYVVALNRGGNMERFSLSDGENRYGVALGLLATERRGTVKSVPLLARLGANEYEVTEVQPLIRNSQVDWTSTKRAAVRNEFSPLELRSNATFLTTGNPVLRRTIEGVFTVDWYGDDDWKTLSTNGNWHARAMVDTFIDVDVANVDDVRASLDLTDDEAIVARTTDAVDPLVTTTAGLDRNRRCETPEEWQEQRSEQFILVHSDTDAELANALLTEVISDLEADYAHFTRLFDATLSTPITIRIYPQRDVYSCLNVVAPELPPGRFHSHLGEREVVLIGSDLEPANDTWSEPVLNALRYEVAALFTAQLSGGAALPGLQAAVGAYAQDPQYSRRMGAVTSREPRLDWRFLWEEDLVGRSAVVAQEAMTTVAYLVEGHGWPAFLRFLTALSDADNYRLVLADTYGVEATRLQAEWQRYHPLYFSERWRSNVFHGFDLSVYELLLEAGAYTDAEASLQEAITFLETVGAAATIAEAQALREKAIQGQAAAALVRESRRALQNGQYEESIAIADEAEALYQALGDSRRLEELDVYRRRAQEILRLQDELEQLTAAGEEDEESVARLQTVGQRLAALGEESGAQQAEAALQEMEAQRRAQIQAQAERIMLVIIVLLIIRILFVLRRQSAEARLL